MRPSPRQAVAGTYANLRPVPARSVVQIIIEVPVERAHEVTALLGWPNFGAEQWVALAPIGFDPYGSPRVETPASRAIGPVQRDLDREGQNAVTACAIRCQEPAFQRWLLGPPPAGRRWTEDDAATEVRRRLGIGSRADIAASTEARRRWKTLLAQYMEAMRDTQHR